MITHRAAYGRAAGRTISPVLHDLCSKRILAPRLDLGGMQERLLAACRLARMIGERYVCEIEKQPNEVQTI